MTIQLNKLTCAFCGREYGPGVSSTLSPMLTQHILHCPRHPMRIVEKQRDKLLKELKEVHDLFCDFDREDFFTWLDSHSDAIKESIDPRHNTVTLEQAEEFRLKGE